MNENAEKKSIVIRLRAYAQVELRKQKKINFYGIPA
jgi:hypothetical protein